ncbi:7229_t:CDS:2, partial [Cetraspora pellucida]
VALTVAQKYEICNAKEKNLNIKNIDLASQYSIDNALNTEQDIDDHILKIKAKFFTDHFHIEDFHQSDDWLTGFKKHHGLHQFKKE